MGKLKVKISKRCSRSNYYDVHLPGDLFPTDIENVERLFGNEAIRQAEERTKKHITRCTWTAKKVDGIIGQDGMITFQVCRRWRS